MVGFDAQPLTTPEPRTSHLPDMSDRDWNKELAKIDRLIDEEPVADARAPTPGAGGAPGSATPSPRGMMVPPGRGEAVGGVPPATGVRPSRWARAGLATLALAGVVAVVGTVIWPFGWRCGTELALYLGAVGGTGLFGLATAVAAWRHRAGRTHVLGLFVLGWALALVAWQVLPRVGHALPTPDRPAIWSCA